MNLKQIGWKQRNVYSNALISLKKSGQVFGSFIDLCRLFGYSNLLMFNIKKEEGKMGLFDFVGDIGRKLFSKAEDASEAVTKHIAEDNPGVDNVAVTVENGVANIQGVAASATALEKAILMAGNIAGITSVNADSVTIQSGENLAGDDEFYVIQKGDTLWAIAEKTYGNGAKYTAIVEANKEVIKDADKIFPGQKIRLPKAL